MTRLRGCLRRTAGRLLCRLGRHRRYVAVAHSFGKELVGETILCRRRCGFYEVRQVPNRGARRAMRRKATRRRR